MFSISLYSVKQVKEKGGLYDLESKVIRKPGDAYNVIEAVLNLDAESVEKFVMMSLNTKNVVTGLHVISVGSLSAAIVHPREVYKAAILNNAASIVVFHNHPSGDLTPSPEDLNITERLGECGKLMGIDLLDHLIIGEGRFLSLKEQGYL